MHRISCQLGSRSSFACRRLRAVPRAAAVAFALALTILPAAAAPALAQPRRIAITGTDQRFFGVPAHVQVAGGLTIVRGVPQPGTFTFSGAGVTLSGAENDVGNGILDANNNGPVWAKLTYTDTATGVTCKGIAQGQLTNALATQSVVARCSNGALLTGTLRDTEVFPPNVAPPTWVKSVFTGELFIPN